MSEGARELCRVSLIRVLIPFMRAPLSWPKHLPKTPPPNTNHLGDYVFNIWIWGKHKHSDQSTGEPLFNDSLVQELDNPVIDLETAQTLRCNLLRIRLRSGLGLKLHTCLLSSPLQPYFLLLPGSPRNPSFIKYLHKNFHCRICFWVTGSDSQGLSQGIRKPLPLSAQEETSSSQFPLFEIRLP